MTLPSSGRPASALATQDLERLRALPYDDIRVGLSAGALAGHPTRSAGQASTASAESVLPGIDEALVRQHHPGPAGAHRETVDDVDYRSRSTSPRPATTGRGRADLQAFVGPQAGNGSVPATRHGQRSTTYSAGGCLSRPRARRRPLPGRLQRGGAGITSGRITVSNATGRSTAVVPGTDGSLLRGLDMLGLSTNTAVEQTVTVSASARTVGAGEPDHLWRDHLRGSDVVVQRNDTDPSSPSNLTNTSGSTVVSEPDRARPRPSPARHGTFTAVPSKVHQAGVRQRGRRHRDVVLVGGRRADDHRAAVRQRQHPVLGDGGGSLAYDPTDRCLPGRGDPRA